ncbi:MAG: hypothetical protein JJU12_07170 [Chlamydiales bacterium]|nr:hypothetical protein [Chlamydiales bacterium]
MSSSIFYSSHLKRAADADFLLQPEEKIQKTSHQNEESHLFIDQTKINQDIQEIVLIKIKSKVECLISYIKTDSSRFYKNITLGQGGGVQDVQLSLSDEDADFIASLFTSHNPDVNIFAHGLYSHIAQLPGFLSHHLTQLIQTKINAQNESLGGGD